MYLAGYTMQEIADVVGVHKDSVSETCRKFIDLEKSDKLLASFQDSEFETPIIQEGQERGEIRKPNEPDSMYVPGGNIPKTLSDIGITRKESSTFQQIAGIC
jgi:hypothetical protein